MILTRTNMCLKIKQCGNDLFMAGTGKSMEVC